MKTNILFLGICLLTILAACDKKEDTVSPCVYERINSFKLESYAESIIRMISPSDTLFWFVNSTVDGGEDIIDSRCNLICITDCECWGVHFCDEEIYTYPQEVIWKR